MSGMAFISFFNEDMKNLVLELNKHTSWERIQGYFNNGKIKNLKADDLSWYD
jgi:hypothetical protein